jgi:hypothetical protein
MTYDTVQSPAESVACESQIGTIWHLPLVWFAMNDTIPLAQLGFKCTGQVPWGMLAVLYL